MASATVKATMRLSASSTARAAQSELGPLEYKFHKARLRSRLFETLVNKIQKGKVLSLSIYDTAATFTTAKEDKISAETVKVLHAARDRAIRNAVTPYLKQMSKLAQGLPDVVVKQVYDEVVELLSGRCGGPVSPYQLKNVLKAMESSAKDWEKMQKKAEQKRAALATAQPTIASATQIDSNAAAEPKDQNVIDATSEPIAKPKRAVNPRPATITKPTSRPVVKPPPAAISKPISKPAAVPRAEEEEEMLEQAQVKNQDFQPSDSAAQEPIAKSTFAIKQTSPTTLETILKPATPSPDTDSKPAEVQESDTTSKSTVSKGSAILHQEAEISSEIPSSESVTTPNSAATHESTAAQDSSPTQDLAVIPETAMTPEPTATQPPVLIDSTTSSEMSTVEPVTTQEPAHETSTTQDSTLAQESAVTPESAATPKPVSSEATVSNESTASSEVPRPEASETTGSTAEESKSKLWAFFSPKRWF